MASTRQVEIYQDPPNPNQGSRPPQRQSYNFGGLTFADHVMQRPIPPKDDIIFHAPSTGSCGRSPLKAIRQPSTSPPKAVLANANNISVSFPPPQPSAFKTDSPKKVATPHMYPPFALQKPLTSIFASYRSSELADKENAAPCYHSDNVAEFPDPSQGYQGSLKRPYLDAEPSQVTNSKKVRVEDPLQPELPDLQTLPLLDDDGSKPQYSYAVLIGMAILRSSERKLTLAQIYKWISDSFSHYRKANDSGWQNSIRHNLSLNKAFIKQERPKDDPGKGNYWAIKPGFESQFVHKEKGNRRPTSSSGPGHKSSSQQLSSEANSFALQLSLPTKPNTRTRPQTKEPSSDATIPASDAPSSADEEVKAMPPPAPRQPQSSPIQDIRSSPPLAPEIREDTPSPIADLGLPALSRPRSRKRKPADVDDSGYFSSLESSATRPYPDPKLPRLDSNRPRIKRGRAEEEIARMRSSSHDISPSRTRSFMKQLTPSLVSSSPLRSLDTALMLPPLTPAVKFGLPPKAPPSTSPNTNLRIHRNKIKELVGSPVKDPTRLMSDEVSYSPAFKISDEDQYQYDSGFDAGFSIFNDHDDINFRQPATASPLKRSARRSEQARKSGNILADITGSNLNKMSPFGLRAPALDSPLKQKSTRSPLRFGSNIDENSPEDVFGLDFFEDEDPDDFGGLDILQGFSKIGSNKPPAVPNQKHLRPVLGNRSHTSLF